jgi:hypothetical protein
MGYRAAKTNLTVEVEVTAEPQIVGKAYLISVESDKKGMPDVRHYVPISTVHELHDGFIVIDKWMAIEKGLRF